MGSQGMRLQRATAKRRREKTSVKATSLVLRIAALLAVIPCGSQLRGGLFISAFSGNFIPRSRYMDQRRQLASCAHPYRRRLPFHLVPQGDIAPCTPSLGLTRLFSTEFDVTEPSEPFDSADDKESEPAVTAGSVEAVDGEAINGEVSPATAALNNVPAANGATQTNGSASVDGKSNGATQTTNEIIDDSNIPIWELPPPTDDIPHPTANGGFSHTKASKAKISAANKGKIPWNKGKARSEETRARIAAGVRARNRERFLKKLQDMGLTEEEYEAQKKEERRKRDAERRARRTAKGGYRPTEETRQKISQILKAKWANGEIKKTPVSPDKVRRGFTHSAETRAKISESLKKRWANDPQYRAKIIEKSSVCISAEDVKKRISATLKKKWEDPEFRAHMISKIANRKAPENVFGETHRGRISKAMKAKWQDAEYRKKALDAMARRRVETGIVAKPRPKKKGVKKVAKAEFKNGIRKAQPIQVREKKKKKVAKKRNGVVASKATAKTKPKKRKRRVKGKKKEPDGSISRLREERRDLYDLLYADEDEFPSVSEGDDTNGINTAHELGDEDLDDFDPYGLEDF